LFELSDLSWLFFLISALLFLLIFSVVLILLLFSFVVVLVLAGLILFLISSLEESVFVGWSPDSVEVSVKNVSWHVSGPLLISKSVVNTRSSSVERESSESFVVVVGLGVPNLLSLHSGEVLIVPSLLVGKSSLNASDLEALNDVIVDFLSGLDLVLDFLLQSLGELFRAWLFSLSLFFPFVFISDSLVGELIESIRSLSGIAGVLLLLWLLLCDEGSVVLGILDSFNTGILGNGLGVIWNTFGFLSEDDSLNIRIRQGSQKSCYDYLFH